MKLNAKRILPKVCSRSFEVLRVLCTLGEICFKIRTFWYYQIWLKEEVYVSQFIRMRFSHLPFRRVYEKIRIFFLYCIKKFQTIRKNHLSIPNWIFLTVGIYIIWNSYISFHSISLLLFLRNSTFSSCSYEQDT